MTADLMGGPPDGGVDPLAPEHVAPLVVYLASPAAAGINGEVFVVHGGVAAVLEPPRIRATFLAADHGSADGMWTLESVHRALSPVSPAVPSGGRFRLRGHAGTGHRDHRLRRARPPQSAG